jgi:hypothetical protein
MRNTELMIIFLFFTLFANAQPYYVQTDGVVSIEAEHFTTCFGEWEEVEGRNAEPMEKQGQGVDAQKGIISGGFVELADVDVRVGWGIPFESANVTAYAGNRMLKASVFDYLSGSSAGDFVLPGYRSFLTWPVMEYSEKGWLIFYNALMKTIHYNRIKQVFFIHGGVTPSEVDKKIISWLEEQDVKVISCSDENLDQSVYSQMPVVVSESVASGQVDTRFRLHTYPVIVGEPFVLNKMGMVIAKEPWEAIEGEFGNALMVVAPQPTDSLVYALHLSSGQNQKIHLLMQGADKRTDEKVIVRLFPLAEKGFVKEIRMEPQAELEWVSSEAFDIKEGIYFLVVKAGSENFKSYDMINDRRYPSYRIDKIVLCDAQKKVMGNGPVSKSENLPEEFRPELKSAQYLPTQVWEADGGVVVIEAEDIDHHKNWKMKTSPEGYTGTGYLVWEGPSRTQSIEGLGGNDDDMNVRQGPKEQMLIIRVQVEESGLYYVNARNIHELEDGDNDAWVSVLGFKPWNEDAFDDRVRRMGDSHKDGKGFTWLDWGVRKFPLKRGINNLYIGGRSVGFGIDRIAVYPVNDKESEAEALDIKTPVSKRHTKTDR